MPNTPTVTFTIQTRRARRRYRAALVATLAAALCIPSPIPHLIHHHHSAPALRTVGDITRR